MKDVKWELRCFLKNFIRSPAFYHRHIVGREEHVSTVLLGTLKLEAAYFAVTAYANLLSTYVFSSNSKLLTW